MPSTCPCCGTPDVVPILYGLPLEGALDVAEQGLIGLGGCTIFADAPCWRCKKCQHEWGSLEGPEGAAAEEAIRRAVSTYRPPPESVRRERQYQLLVQPLLDRVLPAAAAEGADCLVIEYVAGSPRWEDGPNAFLVHGERRELIGTGGLSQYIVDEIISREGQGAAQSIRVRVQDREVTLGLEQSMEGKRVQLSIRLDALAGLGLAPVAPLERPPACPYCGGPLRTPRAAQCFCCGMDWHDPNNVVNFRTRR